MRKTAAITTLGCKLNQYDSERLREQLMRRGYDIVDFDAVADLYVVNSCTVTAKSDRDARRLARQGKRRNPAAFVVLTGCYAEVAPEKLAEIPEIDLVLGNTEKESLASHVPPGSDLVAADEDRDPHGERLIESFAGHTRAFVKVQEGCDAHCAYCIIPQARGASRSVAPVDAVEQVERLVAAGHPEIVLIGVHLGWYGRDIPEEYVDLEELTRWLCEVPGLGRVRFSSIEPCEVSEGIIDLVVRHPKVCRHLHVPLQSGSDAVLAAMGRPYDTAHYGDLVQRVRKACPAAGIGADVMVGFPGETDAHFEATRSFLEALPLSYLHVFAYSPRPGTRAAEMPDQVRPDLKRTRSRVLTNLSARKRLEFAERSVGETVDVVVEEPLDEEGFLIGMSDNYLRVRFQAPPELRGRTVRVRLTAADPHSVTGCLV
ncbi:MAG: tRNA (N(6)-L-threonylcarbamoyladenosine(37)-C(2))-methylthiotransferase MtaB [Armatimonadetes bacterium]|nr:tRNA (N(6)-L-threonylcarbamoyladenosine(37)-C(2))-methylthiotransferase MtaB [Armatimonadota bacterium]